MREATKAFRALAVSRILYILALFGAFHALRSHRLPIVLFLFIACLGAILSISALTQFKVKSLSRGMLAQVALLGLITLTSVAAWTAGLRECGPLRTVILDSCSVPFAYIGSVFSRRSTFQRNKLRALLLFVAAYALLMYDASGRMQRDVHAVDDLKIARDARVALEKLKLGETLSKFRSRKPDAAMDPELTAEKLIKAKILAQQFESNQRISAKTETVEGHNRSTRKLLVEDDGSEYGDDDEHEEQLSYEADEASRRKLIEAYKDVGADGDPYIYEYDSGASYDDTIANDYESPQEKLMRRANPQLGFFSAHFRPHRVLGVCLVIASFAISEASKSFRDRLGAGFNDAWELDNLRYMLAAVVLAVPAAVAYRLTYENIHVGAGSMIYFCFVGSLLLVLPRFTSTLLSGFNVSKRTILMAEDTIPFLIACAITSQLGYGLPAGGMTVAAVISFCLGLLGKNLLLNDAVELESRLPQRTSRT
ncbi:hypothetical protein NDN08_005588 [Rhodosorus marinus]|uniref:Cation/H+ exchanger domain-containing protein n=1 Tax=Rhodosorus marinus TaxID=101924 RepID=A0AAV8V214_9RHOD|nr:hypothetical protein NDN08_005588 [Rhodosorus marinus]